MNILYIDHYAGGPGYGMEFRPHYLAREWIRLGHQVTIVGADFSHLRKRQPRAGREIIDGVEYIWLSTPAYQGNGLGRVKNMLTFLWRLWGIRKKIWAEKKLDLVIASSTYPLDNYLAYYLAREHGAKYIYEVHDLWPLSPMELGNMSSYHPFIAIMQRAENFAYSHVDKVISILPCAEQHMLDHGLARGKFIHIPNGIDLTEWQASTEKIPPEHRKCLDRLRQEGFFILGYAGGHGVSNALIYLLQASTRLRQEKIAIVLVGEGNEKERLIDYVRQENLKNVYFLPGIPKLAIPELLAHMDGLYIGWNKQPLYRFGISPNKLFDYMMAGKAILHSVEAGNDLVQEAGCGISVKAEDPEAIATGIKSLAKLSSNELKTMGARGREFILREHTYRHLGKKFLDRAMDS